MSKEKKKISGICSSCRCKQIFMSCTFSRFFLLTYIYILLILLVAIAIRKRRKSTYTCHAISFSLSLILLIFRFVNINLSFSRSHSVLFYDCVKKCSLLFFSSFSLSSRLKVEQNKLMIIKQHAGSSNSNKKNNNTQNIRVYI